MAALKDSTDGVDPYPRGRPEPSVFFWSKFPLAPVGRGKGEGGVVKWRFRPHPSRYDEEGTSSFVIPAVFEPAPAVIGGGGYLSTVSPREIPAKTSQE